MKRCILLYVAMLGIGVSAFAQTDRIPRFEQYPAKVEQARVKDIRFRADPDTRRFRTVLREALAEGVDFAGHYIIASWGCGTSCLVNAIIDARTGNVYWPKQLGVIYSLFDEPINYRADSRLLVLSVPTSEKGDVRRDSYYEWKGHRLRLLRTVQGKSN